MVTKPRDGARSVTSHVVEPQQGSGGDEHRVLGTEAMIGGWLGVQGLGRPPRLIPVL